MNKGEQIHILRCALEWCLKHGVKAVDYSDTGYWCNQGVDGSSIMPPAHLHVELDRARRVVLPAETVGEGP